MLGATLRTLNGLLGITKELELERSRTASSLEASQREAQHEAGDSAPAMTPVSDYDDLSPNAQVCSKGWDLETDRTDLARLVQSTQGYLTSVELIQARIAKLIQMVRTCGVSFIHTFCPQPYITSITSTQNTPPPLQHIDRLPAIVHSKRQPGPIPGFEKRNLLTTRQTDR